MTSKESILNHEIIFATSDKTVSKMITVLKKGKRIVKIAAKIYTSNLNDKPENIIRRNLFVILGTLYPDAVLSYRSAFECRPSVDGHLYLTYGYAKKVSLPGVTVHLIEGAGAMEGDYPFMGGLYIAGGARAFLENFSQKYSKDGVSKSLPQNVLEEKLEKIIQSGGEEDVGTSRYKSRNIQDQKQQGWRNVFCGFSTGERHVEKRLRNVPQSQQSFCKSDFYAVYDKRSASIFGRQRTYFAHNDECRTYSRQSIQNHNSYGFQVGLFGIAPPTDTPRQPRKNHQCNAPRQTVQQPYCGRKFSGSQGVPYPVQRL
jgi:hypothetical protein